MTHVELKRVGKVFIPVMKFLVFLLGILLIYQAHAFSFPNNSLYKIQVVAVLPFIDTSKIGIENFVKDEIRRVLSQESTLFELSDDKKVTELLKKLHFGRNKTLTAQHIALITKDLKADGLIYGNILKLGSKLKIVVKFKNLKTMEELSAITINISEWYSPESIKDDIAKAVHQMIQEVPYQGIITNANGDNLIMRIDTQSFNQSHPKYVRLLLLREVQKNSLIKQRVMGFSKEEIGVIEIGELNPPILMGKLRYIKPEYDISVSQLVDFVESSLKDHIHDEPITPPTEVVAQNDSAPERISDNQVEETALPQQKNHEVQTATSNDGPTTLEEIEKEYDSEFMIKEGRQSSEAQEPAEKKDENSLSDSNNQNNQILARRLLYKRSKQKYSLEVGFRSGVSFNNYNLESNGSDVIKGGVNTNGIYDFGLSGTFFLRKYFGVDLQFTQGLLKNTVDLNIDEPQEILISKRKLEFNLIGRWYILRKNLLSPYADLHVGYGYFTMDFDEIRAGDTNELAYLTSQLYHGAIVTTLLGFPIIENRLSVEGSLSYWIFPVSKESPEESTGRDPLANAYSFGGSVLVHIYKSISGRVGYEYELFHVDYLGNGSRFLQDVSKADSYDRYHNIFLSVLYKFF